MPDRLPSVEFKFSEAVYYQLPAGATRRRSAAAWQRQRRLMQSSALHPSYARGASPDKSSRLSSVAY